MTVDLLARLGARSPSDPLVRTLQEVLGWCPGGPTLPMWTTWEAGSGALGLPAAAAAAAPPRATALPAWTVLTTFDGLDEGEDVLSIASGLGTALRLMMARAPGSGAAQLSAMEARQRTDAADKLLAVGLALDELFPGDPAAVVERAQALPTGRSLIAWLAVGELLLPFFDDVLARRTRAILDAERAAARARLAASLGEEQAARADATWSTLVEEVASFAESVAHLPFDAGSLVGRYLPRVAGAADVAGAVAAGAFDALPIYHLLGSRLVAEAALLGTWERPGGGRAARGAAPTATSIPPGGGELPLVSAVDDGPLPVPPPLPVGVPATASPLDSGAFIRAQAGGALPGGAGPVPAGPPPLPAGADLAPPPVPVAPPPLPAEPGVALPPVVPPPLPPGADLAPPPVPVAPPPVVPPPAPPPLPAGVDLAPPPVPLPPVVMPPVPPEPGVALPPVVPPPLPPEPGGALPQVVPAPPTPPTGADLAPPPVPVAPVPSAPPPAPDPGLVSAVPTVASGRDPVRRTLPPAAPPPVPPPVAAPSPPPPVAAFASPSREPEPGPRSARPQGGGAVPAPGSSRGGRTAGASLPSRREAKPASEPRSSGGRSWLLWGVGFALVLLGLLVCGGFALGGAGWWWSTGGAVPALPTSAPTADPSAAPRPAPAAAPPPVAPVAPAVSAPTPAPAPTPTPTPLPSTSPVATPPTTPPAEAAPAPAASTKPAAKPTGTRTRPGHGGASTSYGGKPKGRRR